MTNKTYFISDLHIGHERIIEFDNRPFKDLEEMHEALITNWNNVISNGDTVYVLGDVIFYSKYNDIVKQLNGHKILIRGNHDRETNSKYMHIGFSDIKEYNKIKVKLENGKEVKVILSHYMIPNYDGNSTGAYMLHGHSHNTHERERELDMIEYLNNKYNINLKIFNVGCMLPYMDYTPRTLDEIIKYNKEEK